MNKNNILSITLLSGSLRSLTIIQGNLTRQVTPTKWRSHGKN